MKKTIILSLVAATLAVSSCFGIEVLSTGATIGADKCAVQGFYSSTSFRLADTSITQYGPRLVYGINSNLDLILKAGIGSVAGVQLSSLGGGLKFALLKVASNDAVDLSGLLNFETLSANNYSVNNTSLGIVASKDLKNALTVYGLAAIISTWAKVTDLPSSTGTGVQIGAGFKLQLDPNSELLGELSMYNVDSNSYATIVLGMQYLLM